MAPEVRRAPDRGPPGHPPHSQVAEGRGDGSRAAHRAGRRNAPGREHLAPAGQYLPALRAGPVGRFIVLRRTMAKRMRAKLRALKEELGRRMHEDISVTGQWLQSVMRGHARYFGVPRNSQPLWAFRAHLTRLWKQALGRRSQKGGV